MWNWPLAPSYDEAEIKLGRGGSPQWTRGPVRGYQAQKRRNRVGALIIKPGTERVYRAGPWAKSVPAHPGFGARDIDTVPVSPAEEF